MVTKVILYSWEISLDYQQSIKQELYHETNDQDPKKRIVFQKKKKRSQENPKAKKNPPKKNPKLAMSSSTVTSSGDENMDQKHVEYSSAVHKAIAVIDGGALGLLQVVTNQSSAQTKALAGRGFLVFIVIYVILGVWEVTLRNEPHIRNFIGHISHLFGALAAIVLISLISPIFALIVFLLSLGWFLFVMYRSLFHRAQSPGGERV